MKAVCLFYYVCAIIALASCAMQLSPIERLFNQYSVVSKIDFGTGVISHFPKSIGSKRYETYLRYAPERSDLVFYYLELDLSEEAIAQRKSQLDLHCLKKIFINESNCLDLQCSQVNDVLIPKFELNLQSEIDLNILENPDCLLYILETGEKDILGLEMKSGGYCPEVLNPGYTKGVCILTSKHLILYWTILW
ncbi:MAG: hypothetical protein RL092_1574 [Bacteroidota bacterium]